MLAGHSGRGDRTCARMAASRRVGGVAARETSDPGRVAGRERHVFRGRERGASALDPKGGGFGPAPAGGWPAPPEGPVPGLGDAWAPGPPATPEGLWGAPGAASPSDSDGPGCPCPRHALAPSQPNCLAGCWWEGGWAGRASPTPRPGSRPSARASCRGTSATRRRGGGPSTRASRGSPTWRTARPGRRRARRGRPTPRACHLRRHPTTTREAGEGCRPAHVPGRPAAPSACLRVAAGNVVDAATPGRTFAELGAAGLPASWAVPGAGRWSAGNARATGEAGTRFPARPGPNVRAYGDVVAGRPATAREADGPVAHGGRHACAGRPGAELVPGVRGRPCPCVDTRARRQGEIAPGQAREGTGRMGVFALASTADIAAPDVLGAHCARQRIEQVFDVGKNYASLLPPRARSEEAPGGHLPPALCATALSCRPRPGLPAGASSMPQALAAARNQRCKACDDKVITCEPTSTANELYKAIGATCPVEIPLPCGKK